MSEGRQVHLDLLRILACFSVVMLHSASQFWYTLPVTETNWLIANAYDATFRFGVPVFVMISGALFLQGEVNIRRLYTHNILRMVVLYVIWSAIYGLFDCRRYDWSIVGRDDILREIFSGRYHLWYLPMIVGIYMLIPILKKWVDSANKKDLQYFLTLFLIFQVGKETVTALYNTEWIHFIWGAFNLDMVSGYIGYFVLGYYIVRYGISSRWRGWIYLGGMLSVPANIALSTINALRSGEPEGYIFDSFGAFTFVISVSLFALFTNALTKMKYTVRASKVIQEFSMGTLGIYLMHIAVIELLEQYDIHSMMFAPIACIPLFAVCVFLFCFLVAAVLRRIPFVGKYIC